jgi:hypothetical protein
MQDKTAQSPVPDCAQPQTDHFQRQDARSMATELSLALDGVNKAIDCLDKAQHITQDRLQLEVAV